jgi:hypothetical protein
MGEGAEKSEYNNTIHQLFIDIKKFYYSVRREVLHNTLIETGIPRKKVEIIKTFLNEICSAMPIGK